MPTPEEIEETLTDINNDKALVLASFILKGTRIPRSFPAHQDDAQFEKQLRIWRENGAIERLPIYELDATQSERFELIESEIELRMLTAIQRTFQPQSQQPQSQQPQSQQSQNTRPVSIIHEFQSQKKPIEFLDKSKDEVLDTSKDDVLDTTKDDVMRELEQRLKDIKSEVKGFRDGHDQRLMAVALIINEVQNSDERLTSLEEIESKIKQLGRAELIEKIKQIPDKTIKNKDRVGIIKRIEKENKEPGQFFNEGIRSDSTSKKGSTSQYAQMKERINEHLKPTKSTPSLK